MITAIHKITGEQIEFDIKNINDLINAWRTASEYEKLGKELKDKLKPELSKYLDDSGKTEEVDGYQFKSTFVQRKNYDKAVLRQVVDEDTYDLLVIPHKTKVDAYIKENLNILGDNSGLLRDTMIDEGRGYSVTKLERLV